MLVGSDQGNSPLQPRETAGGRGFRQYRQRSQHLWDGAGAAVAFTRSAHRGLRRLAPEQEGRGGGVASPQPAGSGLVSCPPKCRSSPPRLSWCEVMVASSLSGG